MAEPARGPSVDSVSADAWEIPTSAPRESDGTLTWDSTTIVVVEVRADGQTGLGYTYGHATTVGLVEQKLAGLVEGSDAFSVHASWQRMVGAVRNLGRPGMAAKAISAIDVALWDLKARLLGVPLSTLFDPYRSEAPIYGSGGFTDSSADEVIAQLSGWADRGIGSVKMKVGRDPDADLARVTAVREALPDVELMVDANGAYPRKQALDFGYRYRDLGVTWYEEPVSSDDLEGLRLLRNQGPSGLEITAGEYGWDPWYFRHMLSYGAVDVLQADATRCLGYTGFLAAAELCRAHNIDISAHTAPQLHAHVCLAAPRLRHIEYFHDHARIERMIFERVLEPGEGRLGPDRSVAGHGLTLRRDEADRVAA